MLFYVLYSNKQGFLSNQSKEGLLYIIKAIKQL